MHDETYNGEHYESNDVWHNGRGYYYYYYGNGYSYSGSAPTSHVPNGYVPNAPSTDGTQAMPIVLLVYVGEPNFNNYASVNPKAILDEKCTPPPVPEPPAPATPQTLPSAVTQQNDDSVCWAMTKAAFWSVGTSFYDIGNHLTFGSFDEERYTDQVNVKGERLYNISKNLGYSDESIGNGIGLAQALVGEMTGTNAVAEGVAGYDLGNNTMLDAEERFGKIATGTGQMAATLAGGMTLTKSFLRNCFLAGTLISRYSSGSIEQKELVSIEQIKRGDEVWAFNRVTDNWEIRYVLETYRRGYIGDVVAVNIGDEIIDATGGHPFWVLQGDDLENRPLCDCLPDCEQEMTPQGRWVYARDLRIDDVLRSRALGTQKVIGLEITQTETVVYNFLVDDLHNYAVGRDEVLVHNTNGAGNALEKTPRKSSKTLRKEWENDTGEP
jgi:hypothetical protein